MERRQKTRTPSSDPSNVPSLAATENGSVSSDSSASLPITSAMSLLKQMKAVDGSKGSISKYNKRGKSASEHLRAYSSSEYNGCTPPPGRATATSVSGRHLPTSNVGIQEVPSEEQLWHMCASSTVPDALTPDSVSHIASSSVTECDSLSSDISSSNSPIATTPFWKLWEGVPSSFHPQFAGHGDTLINNLFYKHPDRMGYTAPPGIVFQHVSSRRNMTSMSILESLDVYTREQLMAWHPYAHPIVIVDPETETTSDLVNPDDYVQLSKALREQLEMKERMITANAMDVNKWKFAELAGIFESGAEDLEALARYTEACEQAKTVLRDARLSKSVARDASPMHQKETMTNNLLGNSSYPKHDQDVPFSVASLMESYSSQATTLLIERILQSEGRKEELEDCWSLVNFEPPKGPPRQRRLQLAIAEIAERERLGTARITLRSYEQAAEMKVTLAEYEAELHASRGKFCRRQKYLAEKNKEEYAKLWKKLSPFDRYVCNSFSGAVYRNIKSILSAQHFADRRIAAHRTRNDLVAATQWEMIGWNVSGDIVEDLLWLDTFFKTFQMSDDEILFYDRAYRSIVYDRQKGTHMDLPIDLVTVHDPSLNADDLKTFLRRRQDWMDNVETSDGNAFADLSDSEKDLVRIQNDVEGFDPIRTRFHWLSIATELQQYPEDCMRDLIPQAECLSRIPSRVLGKDVGCLHAIAELTKDDYVSVKGALLTHSCSYLQNVFKSCDENNPHT